MVLGYCLATSMSCIINPTLVVVVLWSNLGMSGKDAFWWLFTSGFTDIHTGWYPNNHWLYLWPLGQLVTSLVARSASPRIVTTKSGWHPSLSLTLSSIRYPEVEPTYTQLFASSTSLTQTPLPISGLNMESWAGSSSSSPCYHTSWRYFHSRQRLSSSTLATYTRNRYLLATILVPWDYCRIHSYHLSSLTPFLNTTSPYLAS